MEMVNSIASYNIKEKWNHFIGLKSESVIMEWQNIFEEVVIFVYAMYLTRRRNMICWYTQIYDWMSGLLWIITLWGSYSTGLN